MKHNNEGQGRFSCSYVSFILPMMVNSKKQIPPSPLLLGA